MRLYYDELTKSFSIDKTETFSPKKDIDLLVLLDAEEHDIMPPYSDLGFINQAIKKVEKTLSRDSQQVLRKYQSTLNLVVAPKSDPKDFLKVKKDRFNQLQSKVFKDPNYSKLKEELRHE